MDKTKKNELVSTGTNFLQEETEVNCTLSSQPVTSENLFPHTKIPTDRFRTPNPFAVFNNKWSSAPRPSALKEGSLFRNYAIIRKLSHNPDSYCYLAVPEENQVIAGNPDLGVLKLYHSPENPAEYLQKLGELQEKSRLQSDDAKTTPEILAYGSDDRNYVWHITKYMETPSLESFIQAKAPLGEHKALFAIYSIAALLHKAYPVWGAHGRLKPSKILFGLKKAPCILGAGQNPLLYANKDVMLPREEYYYASPEYIRDGEISWQSDIFSLGIIFYRLLSGVLPFYAPTADEVKKNHLEMPLPPLSAKNPAIRVSTPTLGVLNRMTMKDPSKRFLSMEKLLDALIQADDALPDEEKE